MDDNDLPSKDIEKLIELWLWQQEDCLWNISLESYHKKDLKGNQEAFDNKYTGVYMHKFCWERATGNLKLHTKVSSSVQKSMIHTKVADKSFIVCIGLKVASFCDLPRKGW